MAKGNIVYKKDESLAGWVARYTEEHGHPPKKPIYCDYRTVDEFKREIVIMADGTLGDWMVVDYDYELHGEIDERYHKFIPHSGNN